MAMSTILGIAPCYSGARFQAATCAAFLSLKAVPDHSFEDFRAMNDSGL
jgi:hypothetical protein